MRWESLLRDLLALETSTCQRTLTASGCLIEVVRLDGRCSGLTDEEMEKFRRDGLTYEEPEKFVKNFPVRDHSMKEP